MLICGTASFLCQRVRYFHSLIYRLHHRRRQVVDGCQIRSQQIHGPVLIPIAASPPQKKVLILEQRRCRIIQPETPLRMNNLVLYCNLEIPADNQISNQRHIHFTSPCLTKRLPFGSEPQVNQRHIRRIDKIDFINASLII